MEPRRLWGGARGAGVPTWGLGSPREAGRRAQHGFAPWPPAQRTDLSASKTREPAGSYRRTSVWGHGLPAAPRTTARVCHAGSECARVARPARSHGDPGKQAEGPCGPEEAPLVGGLAFSGHRARAPSRTPVPGLVAATRCPLLSPAPLLPVQAFDSMTNRQLRARRVLQAEDSPGRLSLSPGPPQGVLFVFLSPYKTQGCWFFPYCEFCSHGRRWGTPKARL